MPSRTPSLSRRLGALVLLLVAGCGTAGQDGSAPTGPPAEVGRAVPVVVAHRGASGYAPEHTLAAYRTALDQGADYLEPDLVATKDGVLVVRHRNDITRSTDVAEHPELADRRTTRTVGDDRLTGWFTDDLTLAELRTLRAVEPDPEAHPASARTGEHRVLTFEEFLRFVADEERRTGRRIRIAPEIKDPAYFEARGLPVVEETVRLLREHGWHRRPGDVLLQCFDAGALRRLDRTTDYPLVRLVEEGQEAYLTPGALAQTARYADGVAPEKEIVLGTDPTVVVDAHDAGLEVLVWEVRSEEGDVAAETRRLLDAGVDGVFADEPDLAVAARDAWLADRDAPRAG